MKAELIGTEVQNSPAWHALRSNGLGGSEIAAVVGLSPWVSRFALYHRKRGEIPPQDVNAGMSWGHRLEPVVCDAWAEQHAEFWPMESGTYRNTERPWQLANVDRLLYPTTGVTASTDPLGIFEAKTAHQYDAYEWGNGPEDIPPYYRCQALWYLDTLGLPVAHLAVLIGGSDYREYEIGYAAAEAEWLREQGRQFWADVVDGNAPPLDGHAATYQAVRQLHPDIESGEEVELGAHLWGEYLISKEQLDTAKDRHQTAKAEVLDQMGQAQFGCVDGVSVLRRQAGRGGAISLQPVKTPKESAA